MVLSLLGVSAPELLPVTHLWVNSVLTASPEWLPLLPWPRVTKGGLKADPLRPHHRKESRPGVQVQSCSVGTLLRSSSSRKGGLFWMG